MINNTITILTFLLFLTHLNAQDVQKSNSFSLEEAQQYAIQNNVTSKNAQLSYEQAQKQAKEVITRGLPKLEGEISYQNNFQLPTTLIPAEFTGGPEGEFIETEFGTEQNVSVGGTATQLIVDGRYFVGLQANETMLKLNKNRQKMDQRDVRHEVEKAFYSALVAKENVEVLKKNLSTVKTTLHETNQQYKNGFVEKLDVDRLQLSVNNLQTQVENAKAQQQLSRNVLKFRMGYPIKDTIILKQDLQSFIEEKQETITQTFKHTERLEYKILQDRIAMKDFDRKQILADYMPSVHAFVSYEETAQRDAFNFFDFDRNWFSSGQFGVTINMPIFDSFQKGFRAQQKKIEHQKLLNRFNNFQQSATLEVKQAKTEFIKAKNRLENQKKNLELAEKIYNKTATKYNEGVGSSLEVTDAESSLTTSRANYINAVFEYLMAKTELKKAKGGY